jgi:hypothetical protein
MRSEKLFNCFTRKGKNKDVKRQHSKIITLPRVMVDVGQGHIMLTSSSLTQGTILAYLIVSRKTFSEQSSSLINPLTPKLNPSAQRYLTTRFLLEILLLETCISLINA